MLIQLIITLAMANCLHILTHVSWILGGNFGNIILSYHNTTKYSEQQEKDHIFSQFC